MTSWLLRDGKMRLSVPESMEHEIRALLRPGQLCQSVLQEFVLRWEIVGAEASSEGKQDPAIFLIHRETKKAIVVGAWPNTPPVVQSVFDPDEYFRSPCVQPVESETHQDPHAVPALLPISQNEFNARDASHRSITKSLSVDSMQSR